MNPTPGQLLPYDGPPVTWGTALAIEAVCETVEEVYAGTGVSFGIHEVAQLAGVSSQQAGRVLLNLHRPRDAHSVRAHPGPLPRPVSAVTEITDDRVPLHPYYSGAQPSPRFRTEPLLFAPRYVRTRAMGRWHRPRYGHRHHDGRESVTMWCGQAVMRLSDALGRGAVPSGEDACGTCEGRALGAGVDPTPDGMPRLLFTGNYGQPPKRCPGSRSERLAIEDPDNWRRATCRVCHEYVKMRAGGPFYASTWGMALHPPGPGLVEPCPEHGWHHLRPWGESGVTCACRIPGP